MKGLIYRELYLARKNIGVCAVIYVLIFGLTFLTGLSLRFGNIAKYGAPESNAYLLLILPVNLLMCAAILIITGAEAVFNVSSYDLKTPWMRYALATPAGIRKLVGAKYLTYLLLTITGLLVSGVSHVLCLSVCQIKFTARFLLFYLFLLCFSIFGTDCAMGIVQDARPESVADLIRIAGIAHGTDVWKGNVQDLIVEGTATLKESICTRDDIMLYLISKGMDPALSFKIMESVRKGKVAKKAEPNWPDWKQQLESHEVPGWYIGSAEKIQYMFPKAHAAAYVMMALRVAYCKVHHPLEYYAAYYSIRADGFDYALMCMGRDVLNRNLALFRRNRDTLSDKEKLVLRDMRLVEEMYARGIEFTPIDLYKAQAKRFTIVDGKIMPSFMSIAGLGETAALSLEEAAKEGRFLSREDLLQRSKLSATLVDTMAQLGILGNMAESNQLSFSDLLFE